MAIKRPYGVTPFWFWNDDLEEEAILRQIAAMDEAGVGGFVIHPRVGLPKRLGWMSQELLAFMQTACREAARRELRVILYDEGMYPSGSSSGQVVSENPSFACRGLQLLSGTLSRADLGPKETIACRTQDGQGREHTVVDLPLESHIRGLYYLDESTAAEEEPPAADLLNPEAMSCFLRLVHGRFAQMLGDWFGSTITGIFTDEPSMLGRGAPKGVIPGTTGIIEEVKRITGQDFAPLMGSVFLESEPDHDRIRALWVKAVRMRLEETYYTPMRQWCDDHGLELMGHPEKPDDLALLKRFRVPGQDLVWRWVLPGPSATQGPQSTQAKVASSAAWMQGAHRNSSELFGAYGKGMTLQEMKWLAGWAMIRGQNWLIPHAYFFSVRGPRADERPPDVGFNSPWRNELAVINAEWEALCQAIAESEAIITTAVLARGDSAPWKCPEVLYQSQIDFYYLDCAELRPEQLSSDGTRLTIRDTEFTALVFEEGWEEEVPDWLTGSALLVSAKGDNWLDSLRCLASPSLTLRQPVPGLRARRMHRDGRELALLFNEEQSPIEAEVTSPSWLAGLLKGEALCLDPGEIRLYRAGP